MLARPTTRARTSIRTSAGTDDPHMVTPSRIGLAIRRRRLTRKDLAVAVDVDDKTVRRWLDGSFTPTNENLARLSEFLRFPIDFFSGHDLEEIDPSQPSFRARRTSRRLLSAATQSAALAFEIERVLVEELRFRLPPKNIPELPVLHTGEPEAAAAWVREQWGLRDRPIKSVIGLLERNGVRVFSLPADLIDGKVSAFCVENKEGTPFVLLNTRDAFSGDRTRFDAAHELGHLVMHRRAPEIGPEQEPEADQFASAFLMPRDSVLRVADRAEASIECLQWLKLKWGVSVAALARRLRDLNVFSERQYKRVCIELSRYGRKREPNPIRGEASRLIPKILGELRGEGGVSMLAALTLLHENELGEYLFGLTMTVVESPDDPPAEARSSDIRPRLSLV